MIIRKQQHMGILFLMFLLIILSGCAKEETAKEETLYTLAVTVEGYGQVTPNVGNHQYPAGTIVNLTTTADSNYAFLNWSGPDGGTVSSNTIVMDNNKVITAIFKKIQHNVTVTINPLEAGTAEVALMISASGLVDYGQTVRITAKVNPGYKFSYWRGDLNGSDNPATLTVDRAKTITGILVAAPTPTVTPTATPTVTPKRVARILVVNDELSPVLNLVGQGLAKLQTTRSFYYKTATSIDNFNDLAATGYWDLFVVNNSSTSHLQLLNSIQNHIDGGGGVVFTSFQMLGSTNRVWASLGASFGILSTAVADNYRWDPGNAIFTTPYSVPDMTGITNFKGYGNCKILGTQLAGCLAVAGSTVSSQSDQATIFVANEGRTVLNSFMIDCMADAVGAPRDNDSDGIADAVELWADEINYVLDACWCM